MFNRTHDGNKMEIIIGLVIFFVGYVIGLRRGFKFFVTNQLRKQAESTLDIIFTRMDDQYLFYENDSKKFLVSTTEAEEAAPILAQMFPGVKLKFRFSNEPI